MLNLFSTTHVAGERLPLAESDAPGLAVASEVQNVLISSDISLVFFSSVCLGTAATLGTPRGEGSLVEERFR